MAKIIRPLSFPLSDCLNFKIFDVSEYHLRLLLHYGASINVCNKVTSVSRLYITYGGNLYTNEVLSFTDTEYSVSLYKDSQVSLRLFSQSQITAFLLYLGIVKSGSMRCKRRNVTNYLDNNRLYFDSLIRDFDNSLVKDMAL